jgi:hypothetical protein
MYEKVSSPEDVATLHARELLRRVRPLLRKAGFTTNDARFRRISQNVPSVLWELAAEWQSSPLLGRRPVEFDEYIAARLCNHLHTLDRQQHRHLYPGGRYAPEREPLPLDEAQFIGRMPSYGLLATSTPYQRIADAMTTSHIAAASYSEVFARLDARQQQEPITEHTWRIRDGASRELARRTPATEVIRYIKDIFD